MDPAVIGIASALVAALGGYFVAARKLSGRINTTEAQELWKESKSIRDWSQQRIDSQDAKIARLEERLDTMFKENVSLGQQVIELKKTIVDHEGTIRDLTDQLVKARTRVTELERKTNGI